MNALFRVPTALFAGLLVAAVASAPLGAQEGEVGISAELVREALRGPGDGSAWTALEQEAVAAADGPFVLRELRVDADGLHLGLGGYGLPSLEQTMKVGAPTRVVVVLPGARTALPHGHEVGVHRPFSSVRVRQAPFGVEVEAVLPAGLAAVLDEDADGVRIRVASASVDTGASRAAARLGPALAAWTARTWLDGLRAGRPLALFPLAAVAASALLLLSLLWGRRRSGATATWQGVSDARRLADRLAPAIEPRGER